MAYLQSIFKQAFSYPWRGKLEMQGIKQNLNQIIYLCMIPNYSVSPAAQKKRCNFL